MNGSAAEPNGLVTDISDRDEMFKGDNDHYFGVGKSALECIQCALQGARLPSEKVGRILDLPCGHGRVMRYLAAAFPHAELVGCDLLRDGVDYCAQTFGAQPVYSDEDPAKIALGDATFDLIWVGSLLTHLDAARWTGFLQFFRRVLRPGGVLVFTTHGRNAYDRTVRGENYYGLPYWRTTAVRNEYERNGFGYAEYLKLKNYGQSLSSPDWVFKQLSRIDEFRVAYFGERAWDNHQDVFACVRDSNWKVRHPPVSTWTLLKHKVRERVRP